MGSIRKEAFPGQINGEQPRSRGQVQERGRMEIPTRDEQGKLLQKRD